MKYQTDEPVMIVKSNGEYRYGSIMDVIEDGEHLLVCLHEEGDSKIAFDQAANQWAGTSSRDWSKSLSEKETRILNWLANDVDTKAMSMMLEVAQSTMRNHLRVLRIKLGLQTRNQMVVYARGLVKTLDLQES